MDDSSNDNTKRECNEESKDESDEQRNDESKDASDEQWDDKSDKSDDKANDETKDESKSESNNKSNAESTEDSDYESGGDESNDDTLVKEAEEKKMRKRKKHKKRWRRKRGRRKRQSKVNLTIMHTNPRGWTSKQESLLKLIKSIDPDIININETQLTGNSKVNIKSYTSFCKNQTLKIGGGICSSVANRIKQDAVCVAEADEEDEWLAVRYDHVAPALTIVNCYGEQEGSGRSNNQEVVARWGRLLKVLEAGRLRGDHVLLVGDLNKHVGNDHLGVPGNKSEVTTGGRMVRDLVEGGNWRIINALEEVVKGGPFTRRDPASGKESLLDLWVCTAGLAPFVKEMFIDSSRKYKVARPVWKDGSLQLTHSDHYTIVTTFHNLPAARVAREEQEVRWNIAQKQDWIKYKEESKEVSTKVKKVAEQKEINIDEVLKKVESIETKIKFKVLGKCSIKSKTKREAKMKQNVELKTEEEKARDLLIRQTNRVDYELKELEEQGFGRVSKLFHIAKSIKGLEKGAGRATAIKNPATGELVTDQAKIKSVTLEHCMKVLAKDEPTEDFKAMAKMKVILHNKRMKLNPGDGFKAEKEVFDQVIEKFKKNNKRNSDFIVKASEEFKS